MKHRHRAGQATARGKKGEARGSSGQEMQGSSGQETRWSFGQETRGSSGTKSREGPLVPRAVRVLWRGAVRVPWPGAVRVLMCRWPNTPGRLQLLIRLSPRPLFVPPLMKRQATLLPLPAQLDTLCTFANTTCSTSTKTTCTSTSITSTSITTCTSTTRTTITSTRVYRRGEGRAASVRLAGSPAPWQSSSGWQAWCHVS
jgi:hypothetical protein